MAYCSWIGLATDHSTRNAIHVRILVPPYIANEVWNNATWILNHVYDHLKYKSGIKKNSLNLHHKDLT
jgi:hypothetical protein